MQKLPKLNFIKLGGKVLNGDQKNQLTFGSLQTCKVAPRPWQVMCSVNALIAVYTNSTDA